MDPSVTPRFPLRILFDDGEALLLETPEELIERFDSIDSLQERDRIWIRDADDRTVRLRINHGQVAVLECV